MEHNTHTGVLSSRDTSGVSGGRRLRRRPGKKDNMVICYHPGGGEGGGGGVGFGGCRSCHDKIYQIPS